MSFLGNLMYSEDSVAALSLSIQFVSSNNGCKNPELAGSQLLFQFREQMVSVLSFLITRTISSRF